MSDRYEAADPWDEGPEALRPPTAHEKFFRDDDGNFDYEAYYYANSAAAAAASIGRAGLADGIVYYGVADLRAEQMTPRLVEAIENFQNFEAVFGVLSPGQRTSEVEDQRMLVEPEALSAVREALEKQGTRGLGEVSGPGEFPLGARHVNEGRRVMPATPLFDCALKDRQKEMVPVAGRGSAGRMRVLLEKIRRTKNTNDVGLSEADARGQEQARGHGFGRGW